jgi:hypothetical protein
MPAIPQEFLRSIAFMFSSPENAEKNTVGGGGGSAFLVGKPMEGVKAEDGGPRYLVYAVTNRHVVRNKLASVIRLNRNDSCKEVIDLKPNDWTLHPDGDDIAAVYLSDRLESSITDLRFVETQKFLIEAEMASLAINVGDDIFMLGRFVNHPGDEKTIKPAVRIGNISMLPTPVGNVATKTQQLSFAVEMRSRAGFSGAPVAVYRTPSTNPFGIKGERKGFWRLLGVNWGYVYDEKGENSYLNGVVPAWRVLQVLEMSPLRQKHDAYTNWCKKKG